MSTQLKHRRGTTAQHSTFTGASGEITIDTDKKTVVVHDGSTAGGFPLLGAVNPNYTGTLTGGTGVINIGSGQIYKDASGNVGIGTSSPGAKLDVSLGRVYFSGNSDQNCLYLRYNNSTSGVFLGSPSADAFTIGDHTGTERMRIDSSGNVGIGTSSPTSGLEVVKPYSVDTDGAASKWTARFKDSTAYAAGVGGSLLFQGIKSSGGSAGNFAGIAGRKENATDNNEQGYLGFYTTPATGVITERMRIDSSGYLLVGYTSSNGAYKLQVNSQIFATSSTIATSDKNYKTDVVPLSGMLDVVTKLNPVQFSWKKHPVHNFDTSTPTVGFLAQEVQETMADKPFINSIVKENETELPDGTPEKFLGIAEGNMIAILTKAIQELNAKVDAQAAEIATLKGIN